MKIVDSNPPEWIMQGCMNKFRLQPGATVWTYGDTIFAPGRASLPDHIIAHESQHEVQQTEYMSEMKCKTCGHQDVEDGFVTKEADDSLKCPKCGAERSESFEFVSSVDAWWREFLANPRFRLEQEAEAYGAQYRFFCERVKDRNRRALFLMQIAGQLSGPLYQVAVSTTQARQMIEVLSGQKRLA